MIFIIKNNFIRFLFLFIFIFCGFYSCGDHMGCTDSSAINYDTDATSDDGTCLCANSNPCLDINFRHFVDELEIIYGNDNIVYENNAGTVYSVRRLLYVLSDIVLFFQDGSSLNLDELIFVNTDDETTLNQIIYNLPKSCSGINFRLGFKSEDNIDNQYINIENNFHSLMLWPNTNGVNPAFQGGYHYMKLEGKYIDSKGVEKFYNNHTGPTNGNDFSSIHSFIFDPSPSISVNMNTNNWYNNPIYDFNVLGSAIMDNIEAQDYLYQNALDVFTIQTN